MPAVLPAVTTAKASATAAAIANRDALGGHLTGNIENIAQVRAVANDQITPHQRFIERVTRRLGQPRTVYAILVISLVWGVGNAIAKAIGLTPLDPAPFFWLQGVTGLAALAMTAMILTTQNRLGAHAEQRAHLDLQVNLLSEQKAAKIIALLEELRRDLPNVRDRVDATADVLSEAIDPQAVAARLEERLRAEEDHDR